MRTQDTLTITSGQTTSGALKVPSYLDFLVIEAPATLTGTVTLEGSTDGGTTFKTMYSGGSAITIAANGIHTISPVGVDSVRLVSGAAEGANRAFLVRATR